MFVFVAMLCLAAAPEAGAANEAALLKTFREEFVAIAPGTEQTAAEKTDAEKTGTAKFPKSLEVVDGKRTRTLTAPQPYLIAKYEVPQNLWAAVMGSNPSRWKGPRNSVEMLSLGEAQEFCKRATEKLRAAKLIDSTQTVRLPTSDEWEYASRAGTTTRYFFGDDVKELDAYAWHTGNAAGNDPAVGEKKPNAWGLYDTHGYLWEWCEVPGRDPQAPPTGLLRGGSWKDKAELLANDYSRPAESDLRDDAVGLRCVLTMPAGR